ncbi:cardiolipin synthetase [Vibrio ishigakensis]|uniref:Cardiolipin synthase A n=1 Tax=Vibrio ishigakensis TaxID=1481914 RepID=A0A0B8PH11_9VIBR|nr:cardiolipin synthase [Vibrio ishigakensis]GAM62383.1 cardiolipin synthetase [Vibrio ishigakensis]
MEGVYHVLTLVGVALYWILVAGVTIRVVIKRRSVSVSLAWLMIIYILPFVGVFCYFLFGELNLGRKRAERARTMFEPYKSWFLKLLDCNAHLPEKTPTHITHIDDLCTNRMGIPALCGNTLSLQDTPEKILKSIVEDIEQAKREIRMEFYIWNEGGLANSVASALIQAAGRGVKCQVLLDAAGSRKFFKSSWYKMMRAAGVDVIAALQVNPWRMFLRRLDLRQHRKIIVIDDEIAYTGSMNLVDPEFFKQDSGVGQWVDVMVRVTGPTVNVLSAIHCWDWEVETGQRDFPAQPECDVEPDNLLHPIQVVPSGPGMPDNLIQQVLNIAISRASESVTFTTPYFVPSAELLETIRTTAQRGVKVELIIPKKNDSIMVGWASKSYYSELLAAGVIIHEFEGGLLHTKSVVIDKQYCLIGTVNLDVRSLWLNFEVTLVVDDAEFTQQLYWLQEEYIKQSTQVDKHKWRERGMVHRFLERSFYLFSPVL